jgi:hypothetical protein
MHPESVTPMHTELPVEYQPWVDQAISFARGVGHPGLVLLVGSRGAGYADSWSDLDLCILGDKGRLTPEDRLEYSEDGQVFRDRGDTEAHWTFYDWSDTVARLKTCEPVFTWITTRSVCLNGPQDAHDWLLESYSSLPLPYAELFSEGRSVPTCWTVEEASPWRHGVMPRQASQPRGERSTRPPGSACSPTGSPIPMGSGS